MWWGLVHFSNWFMEPLFLWWTDKGKGKGERGVVCGQVWWPILRICALHLTHPSVHTVVDIHPEQWAANAAAPGEQLGVRCLAQGSHLSRGIEGGESVGYSLLLGQRIACHRLSGDSMTDSYCCPAQELLKQAMNSCRPGCSTARWCVVIVSEKLQMCRRWGDSQFSVAKKSFTVVDIPWMF